MAEPSESKRLMAKPSEPKRLHTKEAKIETPRKHAQSVSKFTDYQTCRCTVMRSGIGSLLLQHPRFGLHDTLSSRSSPSASRYPSMTSSTAGRQFRFSIDRGGTFTDVYAEVPGANGFRVLKLLSEDPENYPDAPREGVRRILEVCTCTP